MTLGAVCSEYNLSLPEVIRGLSENNIKAGDRMTIKQMAQASGVSPMAVFERLHALEPSGNPR
jgi:DNA-binding GntR family transcriptional regulator